jgi:hypothetical protein
MTFTCDAAEKYAETFEGGEGGQTRFGGGVDGSEYART